MKLNLATQKKIKCTFSKENDSPLKVSRLNREYFYISITLYFKSLVYIITFVEVVLFIWFVVHSLHISTKEMKIFLTTWNVCILPW